MNSDKGVTEAYCRMVLSELQQIELKSIERREISEQIKKRVQFNFEIVAGVISFFCSLGLFTDWNNKKILLYRVLWVSFQSLF